MCGAGRGGNRVSFRLTFASHAHFQALFQAAILTLIAMMLIYGTVSAAAARVGEIASHGALEERFAACKEQENGKYRL